jgi:hypothetical protein
MQTTNFKITYCCSRPVLHSGRDVINLHGIEFRKLTQNLTVTCLDDNEVVKHPVLHPMSYTASPSVRSTTHTIPLRNHAPPRHGVFSGLDITPLLHTINMVHRERCETNIHGLKPIVRALNSIGFTVCRGPFMLSLMFTPSHDYTSIGTQF